MKHFSLLFTAKKKNKTKLNENLLFCDKLYDK